MRSSRGCESRMPSASTRIRSTWAETPSRRSCRSRLMPLVMARAMRSAATPAATPAMEMMVTTPTTACRRLAFRYRDATYNSNRIESILKKHYGLSLLKLGEKRHITGGNDAWGAAISERRASSWPHRRWSMPEVPHSGEDHGHAQLIGGGDDFFVAHGASGLDNGGGASGGYGFEAVGEGEEGVGGGDAALERQHGLHGAEAGGVHAAHLARADAEGLAVARIDDGVRLDVLADAPGEKQAAQLLGCRR